MDKLTRYKTLIKEFMAGYAELLKLPPKSDLEVVLVFDDERGQYLLFRTGWREKQHVQYMTLYVCLRNGKIWIEEDMTEEGVATYFLEQGVPKEDIVLGFQPPVMRPFTEFATA
jgi:hypothetical protein